MRKPSECLGCPFFGDGDGFVPDEIVEGAKVDVWLQNPGDNEERKGIPAVGSTGDDLNEKFLPKAGLTRGEDVNVRNVLRCRWQLPSGEKTNKLPSGKTLVQAVKHCRVHDQPTGAEVSVAAGALAWRMFDGPGSITDWRGFPHPEKKVLGTLHPADLYRNPAMKLPVSMDWAKVPNFREGTWPKSIPPFLVVNRPADAHLVTSWVGEAIQAAPWIVMDTEFTRDTKYLLTLGIGYPNATGIQIWFNGLDPVARQVIRTALWRLVSKVPTVFQNAMADIPVMERSLGIHYHNYCQVHDTMLGHAVLWSEWPHDLGYLASLYGQYPKMKHLSQSNPKLYNWGDVLDTMSVWEGLSEEFKRDPLSKQVYESQSLPLVPIILKRASRGLLVDQPKVREAMDRLDLRQKWAARVASATVGRPFNLGSPDQLKKWLYETCAYPEQLDKQKKLSIGSDAVSSLRKLIDPIPDLEEEDAKGLSITSAEERIREGADPILEARVIYAQAKQEATHFLGPLLDQERVYPEVKIHAQASGRWSITNPPLQQFPDHLQDLLIPDPGEVWIGWDWDQIELRLLAALANDRPYLDAFSKGEDVHTLNAVAIFGPPTGQPDIDTARRSFAKRFVYRLNYGGDPRTAGDIPGAKLLGLTAARLVDASNRYLAAHPAMARWRVAVAAEAQRTRVSRTFTGRRRRLLGDGKAAVREAYNHPMQGGVADILNVSTVQIAERAPWATLVYTVHDAAWWACEASRRDELRSIVSDVVTQEWEIGNVRLSIPAKFKPTRRGV